ncbi:hypothetical protein [Amycolatopsis sp. CA-230715]|uniref:hypothetical protein n=1 Tax=Amycolatopsis sp. CA-230715 TaxID=2745196 RepID=UPI001C00F483|nr:hypothetical protein [Amycolatopsis sp. CA-230715]
MIKLPNKLQIGHMFPAGALDNGLIMKITMASRRGRLGANVAWVKIVAALAIAVAIKPLRVVESSLIRVHVAMKNDDEMSRRCTTSYLS